MSYRRSSIITGRPHIRATTRARQGGYITADTSGTTDRPGPPSKTWGKSSRAPPHTFYGSPGSALKERPKFDPLISPAFFRVWGGVSPNPLPPQQSATALDEHRQVPATPGRSPRASSTCQASPNYSRGSGEADTQRATGEWSQQHSPCQHLRAP